MKRIVHPEISEYRATCADCGAVFTYQREDVYTDVYTNYRLGDEHVSCPSCGRPHRHLGAEVLDKQG